MEAEDYFEQILDGGVIPELEFKILCSKAKDILFEEPNVLELKGKITIVGDIHGQFFDLMEIFKIVGKVDSESYLFLGDYVDRGYNSVETIQYLLCLKLKFPTKIFLLRGNHETRNITSVYGLYDEIIRKYGNPNVWRFLMDLFDYMPLAAIINNSIFCVHGGLSPDLHYIDQIRVLERMLEIPLFGKLCDLLWSDPDDNLVEGYKPNERGSGYLYGSQSTDKFLFQNEMKLLCRSHQLVMTGYQYYFPNKNSLTVWSAPNYCYRCGNVGATLSLNENNGRTINIYTAVTDCTKIIPYKNLVPYFL